MHTLQPKYIQALKKAAERRKLEGELVYEHQAQRELEKEANDFRDKESFLTSGYKKKLEERRVLEEELAKEAEFEGLLLLCIRTELHKVVVQQCMWCGFTGP